MAEATSVILGATSALGQAVARLLLAEGERLVLVARDAEKLTIVADDLRARGGTVETRVHDLDNIQSHAALVGDLDDADAFWLFYGTLPDQAACEQDWEVAAAALHTNFTSAASLLSRFGEVCEKRGKGALIVVTSVAGDRGRKSNYFYGTAKGALTLFCQGLRNRLAASGVQVLTVKPGFIDTPMTAALEKSPAILWATPDRVARDIVRARKSGKDELYTPWFWRYILLIICAIPERFFKRLSL